VAFDLPTQMGRDSDHQLSLGEVGKVGVAIDSLLDMRDLFDGIPLKDVSTSMTINATASTLLLLYALVAEEQGAAAADVTGTTQNDILKEYLARGTYIYPPAPSMRITTDLFAYCAKELPRWNTISISGYHIREAGSTAVRSWPSPSPTPSPTSRPPRARASRWTSSPPGSPSSSTPTTTSSRRSPSTGPRGGCGRRSCASASVLRTSGA
jgi:methylmalonyl-CoA mutase N-terminal domain/subunit